MKHHIILVLLVSFWFGTKAQTPDPLVEPDAQPIVLHPGTISNDLPQWNNYFNRKLSIGLFTILVDGKSKIICYPYVNEVFLEGELMPFDDQFSYSDPWINLEGDYMLMQANIGLDGKPSKKFSICESKIVNGNWTQPKPLASVYNQNGNAGSPSLTENGNLYFNAMNSSNGYDIFMLEKGKSKPVALPEQINSKYFEGDFYIDSQEQFIVFSSIDRDDSKGNSDLYIAFKENGRWTKAVALFDGINTSAEEFSPYISMDRSKLVFTSNRNQSNGFIPTYNHFIIDIDLDTIRRSFSD